MKTTKEVKTVKTVATGRQIARIEKSVEQSTKKGKTIKVKSTIQDKLIADGIDTDKAIQLEALCTQQGLNHTEAMRFLKHICIDLDGTDKNGKDKVFHYNLKATFISSYNAFLMTNVSPIGNTVAVVAPLADGSVFVKVYPVAINDSASSLYKAEFINMIESSVKAKVYNLKGADYTTLRNAFLFIQGNGSSDVTMINECITNRQKALETALKRGIAKRDSLDKTTAKKAEKVA